MRGAALKTKSRKQLARHTNKAQLRTGAGLDYYKKDYGAEAGVRDTVNPNDSKEETLRFTIRSELRTL